jgi:hypothetical protein
MIVENNNRSTEEKEDTEEKTVPQYSVKVAGLENEEPAIVEVPAEEIEKEEEKQIEGKEVDVPKLEINEESVLSFLKEKGIEADTLESLKPKETRKLNAEIEKFLEFSEKTGNANYNDFLATQKEWDKEDSLVVLKEMLRLENPTLNNKQIDYLFDKSYTYDEDIADEDEIMDKDISKQKDLQKAIKMLDSRKEEYMVHRGSDELIPEDYKQAKALVDKLSSDQTESVKLAEKSRNEFLETTKIALPDNFEGFKTKIGDKEFLIKPENVAQVRENQSDIYNIQKKFFDNDNKLIDPIGYHKALFAANDPDKYAEHYFNLGKAEQAEEQERISKNIPGNGMRQVDTSKGTASFKVREV